MDVRRSLAAISATALLAGSLALPVFAAAESASVRVTFHVAPIVTAEVVDDGLFIRSNAPWTLVAEDAAGRIALSGPATGSKGQLIEADELADYTLVLDSPR